jgi:hypothetical protein
MEKGMSKKAWEDAKAQVGDARRRLGEAEKRERDARLDWFKEANGLEVGMIVNWRGEEAKIVGFDTRWDVQPIVVTHKKNGEWGIQEHRLYRGEWG